MNKITQINKDDIKAYRMICVIIDMIRVKIQFA